MTETAAPSEVRTDLLRGLLQSCYVIEHARGNVQAQWDGDFDRDHERTKQRAERLGALLDEHGFRRPDDVVGPHTGWFESMCGSTSTEVPLGAAVLHQFSKWSDVFAGPYLGDDVHDFVALGAEYSRVESGIRTMREEEAFLPDEGLPDGRRFVILTDIHIGARGVESLLKQAVQDINAITPEFVVIPGDITDDGEPEQFALVKQLLDGLSCPYYVVPGNHDAVQRSTREPVGARLFANAFDADPSDQVVDCGDLQVALVDTTDPVASPFPDWDAATASVGGIAAGIDSGALRPGQADALAAKIDPSRPVLVVQHHELHPFPGFPPVKFALREEDAEAELAALSRHRLVGIVAGHTHRSAVLGVGDGSVTQLELPSLKDWPFAYSVAGVTDQSVQISVRQISDRHAIWKRAQGMLPLMRRFSIGPLADLNYSFRF